MTQLKGLLSIAPCIQEMKTHDKKLWLEGIDSEISSYFEGEMERL